MQQYDNTNRGILFKNDKKESDKHPDYKGNINVDGQEYWLSAWVKVINDGQGRALSISVQPKEQRPAQRPQQRQEQRQQPVKRQGKPDQAFDDYYSDIPF